MHPNPRLDRAIQFNKFYFENECRTPNFSREFIDNQNSISFYMKVKKNLDKHKQGSSTRLITENSIQDVCSAVRTSKEGKSIFCRGCSLIREREQCPC